MFYLNVWIYTYKDFMLTVSTHHSYVLFVYCFTLSGLSSFCFVVCCLFGIGEIK